MRGEVLGEAQRVPLRDDVEHRAEADRSGCVAAIQAEIEDAVGDDLVALVLEVVLGGPEAVEAELVGGDARRRCTSASRPSRPGCRSGDPSGSASPAPASVISTPPKKNAPTFIRIPFACP